MIPKSCRLFGQDHAIKQRYEDHERFHLKRSWSRRQPGPSGRFIRARPSNKLRYFRLYVNAVSDAAQNVQHRHRVCMAAPQLLHQRGGLGEIKIIPLRVKWIAAAIEGGPPGAADLRSRWDGPVRQARGAPQHWPPRLPRKITPALNCQGRLRLGGCGCGAPRPASRRRGIVSHACGFWPAGPEARLRATPAILLVVCEVFTGLRIGWIFGVFAGFSLARFCSQARSFLANFWQIALADKP